MMALSAGVAVVGRCIIARNSPLHGDAAADAAASEVAADRRTAADRQLVIAWNQSALVAPVAHSLAEGAESSAVAQALNHLHGCGAGLPEHREAGFLVEGYDYLGRWAPQPLWTVLGTGTWSSKWIA